MNITLSNHTTDFLPWRPELGRVFDELPYACDTETTLIDQARPWLIPGYVLGAVSDGKRGYFLQRQHVGEFFALHENVPVIFHNAPFDLAVLQLVIGERLDLYHLVDRKLVWDTQLLHRLLVLGRDGNTAWGKGQSTLETCAELYLDVALPKDTIDSRGNPVRLSYHQWLARPPQEIEPVYLDYLAKDVLATLGIYKALRKELAALLVMCRSAFGFVSSEHLKEQVQRFGPQTHHTQLKGAIVLREITANGLHVDRGAASTLQGALEVERDKLLGELRTYGYLPGQGSQQALQALLQGIERQRPDLLLARTETGKIATSESALESLQRIEPFVDVYLAYRAIEKLLATYLTKLEKGVLHPSFNPLVESGRTSSFGDINAQNLPRDDRVRGCIVPSPGHVFVDADYATLELATLAQTAQDIFGCDSQMARLINSGVDLHQRVAARVMGKDEQDITRDERQKAKAINFGKPGGMGTGGLVLYARQSYGVELSPEEASRIELAWLEMFPEMRKYLDRRLDATFQLADLVGLTPAAHAAATGDRRFLRQDVDPVEPSKILGGMCLKVLRYHHPLTRDRIAYSPADIDFFWNALLAGLDTLPEDVRSDIQRRNPSTELQRRIARYVQQGPVMTITGRLRAAAGYCQQRNTPFQGLAADGAKLALWKLWRAGFRLVNFIHDEVLVEVPASADVEDEKETICRLMRRAMREVVPDIKVGVDSKVLNRWTKEADEKSAPRGEASPPISVTPAYSAGALGRKLFPDDLELLPVWSVKPAVGRAERTPSQR